MQEADKDGSSTFFKEEGTKVVNDYESLFTHVNDGPFELRAVDAIFRVQLRAQDLRKEEIVLVLERVGSHLSIEAAF